MTQFRNLPFEIRSLIYELTLEPRDVPIHLTLATQGPVCQDHHRGIKHVTSSAPVPVALHLCHESRNLLTKRPRKSTRPVYRKAFRIGAAARYVWVNFELDVIEIGRNALHEVQAEKRRIRRLKIERDFYMFCPGRQIEDLDMFPKLEELFIVCRDGRLFWASDVLYDTPIDWPLPRDKVWLSDKDDMVTVEENDVNAKNILG